MEDRQRKSGPWPYLFMGLGQLRQGSVAKAALFAAIELLFLVQLPGLIGNIAGLVTLGTTPQRIEGFDVFQGDHSIFLMVDGVVTLILIAVFALLYWASVVDYNKNEERIRSGLPARGLREMFNDFAGRRFWALLLAPATVLIAFFVLLPIVVTFLVAFTNYSAPDHLPPRNLVDWVGIRNFMNITTLEIWSDTLVSVAIWTLIWTVASTLLNYGLGLGLALLVTKRKMRFRGFWRTLFILPHALPILVVLLSFRVLLSGLGPINTALAQAGFGTIPFLSDPTWARISVIVVNAWAGAPFFMVLLSGALSNIDSSLYEAAVIDGASPWERFRSITMPVLLFQTAPVLIMNFAFNFNNFGAIYLLTSGEPLDSGLRFAGETDIFISWVYKLTLEHSQFHMAAVISIVLFLLVAGLAVWNFRRTKGFREGEL